ncbi:enoyl-CoA hydratase/isomerase family protein [Acrocarpospora catenulata]|uniref:enoyl-CoA hydratase/isomerase family protein n=1 Tax=Acrocarpospora catenulata TaxID=2836182 RepID=UPI0027DEB9BB|nr:enoyl-CoA hydratase/isomerase family protein [Acrocarpospora catenulata]
MTGPVRTERRGAVVVVTIDRPEVFNALNAEVLGRLRAAVLDAEDEARRTMEAGQRALRDIERVAVPVIAAVNGVALGGGFELVLASTFPVLSTRASLGLPESGLGLIPGYGGTQRLPRLARRPAAFADLVRQEPA